MNEKENLIRKAEALRKQIKEDEETLEEKDSLNTENQELPQATKKTGFTWREKILTAGSAIVLGSTGAGIYKEITYKEDPATKKSGSETKKEKQNEHTKTKEESRIIKTPSIDKSKETVQSENKNKSEPKEDKKITLNIKGKKLIIREPVKNTNFTEPKTYTEKLDRLTKWGYVREGNVWMRHFPSGATNILHDNGYREFIDRSGVKKPGSFLEDEDATYLGIEMPDKATRKKIEIEKRMKK